MLAYYREVWKTAVADAVAFWTAHKIATTLPGPIIGFVATWAVLGGIRSWMDFWRAVEISALSGLSGFIITLLVSLVRAPKLLNDQRVSEINTHENATLQIRQTFDTASADLKSQIDDLRALNAARGAEVEELKRPKRTAAEEQRYSKAKAALDKLGEEARIVLRHLQTHGSLTFGYYDPPPPHGMNARDARAFLNLCVSEDLATVAHERKPGHIDYVYTIAPGMRAALDELLYQPNKSSTQV